MGLRLIFRLQKYLQQRVLSNFSVTPLSFLPALFISATKFKWSPTF
ncbi:MAG: hypothetical protein JWQ27_3140 [Ferruginibacter sp.]|nr:hypothetical protein [Ferruginibacter sp.]